MSLSGTWMIRDGEFIFRDDNGNSVVGKHVFTIWLKGGTTAGQYESATDAMEQLARLVAK